MTDPLTAAANIDHAFRIGDTVAVNKRNHTVGTQATNGHRPKTFCGWTVTDTWRWNHDPTHDQCIACRRAAKRAAT